MSCAGWLGWHVDDIFWDLAARKTPRLQAKGEVEQPPLERPLEWWCRIEGRAIQRMGQSRFIPWNQGTFSGSPKWLGQTNQAWSFPRLARKLRWWFCWVADSSSLPNLPMAEWAGDGIHFPEDHFANCFTRPSWLGIAMAQLLNILVMLAFGQKKRLARLVLSWSCWLSGQCYSEVHDLTLRQLDSFGMIWHRIHWSGGKTSSMLGEVRCRSDALGTIPRMGSRSFLIPTKWRINHQQTPLWVYL